MPTNPTKPIERKLVITSLAQYSDLARRHPMLLNFSAFSPIRDVLNRINSKGCKCNSKQDIVNYRPQFEIAMSLLSPNDQVQMKALLNVDKVCYYSRDNGGRLRENCF